MVEGVPANMQYDTGAEVCLITTEMVARLGLSQDGESYWMELASALGAPPVVRVGHPFFSKERSLVCVLFRSFKKNVPFLAFF